ncbi:MAG: sugar transferase [Rubricoccaceae bacterium]
MSRRVELLVLLFADALALSGAFAAFAFACARWACTLETPAGLAAPLLTVGWLLAFAFFGLYQERYARGRFDELVTLVKVVGVGVLALFFGYYLDRLAPEFARQAMLVYGAAVVSLVGAGRVAVRSVQKALILRGYGRHRAVVVGWSDRVQTLYEDLARYPAAGIELVGAVRLRQPTVVSAGLPELAQPASEGAGAHGDPGAGARGGGVSGYAAASGDALPAGALEIRTAGTPATAIAELPRLIDRLGVRDVLVALGSEDHAYLDEVLRVCDGRAVTLKLVPDFYAAVGGMARTEHIYGLPLIELLPEPMPAWQKHTKRLADVVISAAVLVVGLPLWIALGVLVRLTSPGPAIYRQTRVGQHGRPFTMLKYRTMVDGAERATGPVWATPADKRVTPLGRWLRRLRLDEVPQFWNVLKGEMSLVGPRPERPYFVEQLASKIPLYSRRHRVKPGITGLAQVKWRYDADLEDVRQKLKYDLFYLENMSLQMDAKILLQTVRTAVLGKGH